MFMHSSHLDRQSVGYTTFNKQILGTTHISMYDLYVDQVNKLGQLYLHYYTTMTDSLHF